MVDVHSDPSGASDGDGDFPVTVMDKTNNQPIIEHHGNKAELEVLSARAKAHRRALATTVRLPAARKKGAHSRFPAKSSDHSWLARCARSKRSC